MIWWLWGRRERQQDLLRRMEHPRDSSDSLGRQLKIGYLIDWIDSRPEERDKSLGALYNLTMGRGGMEKSIAMAVAVLMGHQSTPSFAEIAFDPATTHDQVYPAGEGVFYHDRIVGQLEEDELEDGHATYRALLRVDPMCLSALSNLSEHARRSGGQDEALELARQAFGLAQRSTGVRYGLPDRAWTLSLRCMLARMEGPRSERVEQILALASAGKIWELFDALDAAEDREQVAVDLHSALGIAQEKETRIWLRVVMASRWRCPPPPLSYGGAAEADEAWKRSDRLADGLRA